MALDFPQLMLIEGHGVSIPYYTDVNLWRNHGVRIAFTTRLGGVSTPPYNTLNCAAHVGDDPRAVEQNRNCLLQMFAMAEAPLIVPQQVHGDRIVVIDGNESLVAVERDVQSGCDGLIVTVPRWTALLNFADCVPVILVGPDGRFAVVHAGWRGVMNRIAVKALSSLAEIAQTGIHGGLFVQDYKAQTNVYIGPYIHGSCFEVSSDLAFQFEEEFGAVCVKDERHVDLGAALVLQLTQQGADPRRICDLDLCTVCNPALFYSYRRENGHTGRHSALAFRVDDELRP